MDTHKPDIPATPPAEFKSEPADFWIRLSAFIIDFICIWIPCVLLAVMPEQNLSIKHVGVFYREDFGLAVFFVIFAYHTLTTGKWGQTLGKFLAGIVTVRKNGEKLGYLRAFGRTLLWYLTLFLPVFWYIGTIPFDTPPNPYVLIVVPGCLVLGAVLQNRIFFYDYLGGTIVIYKRPIGRLRKTAVILFGMIALTIICYEIFTTLREIQKFWPGI